MEALNRKLQHLEAAFSQYQKGEFLDTNRTELGLLTRLGFGGERARTKSKAAVGTGAAHVCMCVIGTHRH